MLANGLTSATNARKVMQKEHLPNGAWVPVPGLPAATRAAIDAEPGLDPAWSGG